MTRLSPGLYYDTDKGLYYVDVRQGGAYGKRIRQYLAKGIDLDDAQRYVGVLKGEKQTPARYGETTIRALWKSYLEYIDTNFSERTYQDVKQCGDVIARHLGQIDCLYISNDVPELYKSLRKREISERKKRPVSNRTINKELSWLSGLLTWARDHDINVPTIKIKYLQYNRPIPAILSPQECHALIMACEPFYRCLFGFLYLCGLRSNEARQIKWADIDTNNMLVKVTGKGNKERIVPVPEWLIDQLKHLERSNEFVFWNSRTKNLLRDYRPALKRALVAAQIDKKISPHSLRHSFGAHSMLAGVNTRVLQMFLGHAKVTTTEIYSQIAAESLRTASNKVLSLSVQRTSRKAAKNADK